MEPNIHMSGSTSGYAVAVEDHQQVRVLVLDRPHKLNAFTAEGCRALAAQPSPIAEDRSSRCACSREGEGVLGGVDLNETSRPGALADLAE